MVLQGDRVVLRPAEASDVAPFTAMLAEPEVARWWGAYDEGRVREELFEDDEVEVYAIVLDGEVVGMIQSYEEDDPEYRHAGIDISLSTAVHDKGIGTDAVHTLARHLIDDLGHHRLIIDPTATNARAIRCYEKVGFREVGVMRRYWRDPDGVWQDGLLLDLLADELAR
jgi:aminoglycoside 6'-N-acetyltransferase